MTLALAAALLVDRHEIKVLVFSETKGYRHDSIPAAVAAVGKMCEGRGWKASFTEDSSWFEKTRLKGLDCVVFLMTTGDVLNEAEQAAFEEYVKAGGGYVGVHAASDTEYDWPWYGRLVGAYFKSHPAIQEAVVRIEDGHHETTHMAPNPWKRTDEWYDFRENPRKAVHVLANVDESTYKDGKMGADHPVVWCHEFDGGRSWYTAMGHTTESYAEPAFMRMLANGVHWAARH